MSLTANAKDFGAAGDGLADDTAAVEGAISWLLTPPSPHPPGGVLFFPAGIYRISEQLKLDPGTGVAPTFVIAGDGSAVSRLVFDGSSAGFSFYGGQVAPFVSARFAARGLSMVREGDTVNGSAFDLKWDGGTGTTESTALFDDVAIRGASVHLNSPAWDVGFRLWNGRGAKFSRCVFHGQNTNDLTLYPSDAFILLDGDAWHVDYSVTNCTATFVRSAVRVSDQSGRTPGSPRAEGVVVTGCSFVAVQFGVEWRDGLWLAVSNTHISSTLRGIFTNTVNQAHIHDNAFQWRENSFESNGWAGVDIASNQDGAESTFNNVSFNELRGLGQSVRVGQSVQNKYGIILGRARHGRLVCNVADNVNTGIWLKPDAANNLVADNHIFVLEGGNAIVDQGTGNTVRVIES